MTARAFPLPVPGHGTAGEVLFEAKVGKSVNPRGFIGFLRLGHFGVQVYSMRLPGDTRLCEFAEFPTSSRCGRQPLGGGGPRSRRATRRCSGPWLRTGPRFLSAPVRSAER